MHVIFIFVYKIFNKGKSIFNIMKEFFKRNKKVLLISLIIFLIFAVGAAVFTFVNIGDDYGQITEGFYQAKANGTLSVNESVPELNTFDLFLHNLFADLIVIVGGVLFSVISLLLVIFNAVSIGIPFGTDLTFFSVTILPHGIIEYAATIFSLACAFNITKLEIEMIKTRSFTNVLNEHRRELKDILIMFVVVVVLLAITAVIECNIVELIAKWYFGI